MSGFSNYYAQRNINADFVSGTTKYLALFVADPTDANATANEVSAGWYVRKPITGWAAPVGAGVTTSNTNTITMPAVTGGAVTVTHWGIYDALTGGNLWVSDALVDSTGAVAPKVLNVDDVFVANPGEIALTWD